MDLALRVIRFLYDGINTLSTLEMIIYLGIFCLWIFGLANLFLILSNKKKETFSFNIRRWLIAAFGLILLKIILFEFINYQSGMNEYWYKLQHLFISDAMLADIFGGLNSESIGVYRISFYIGIILTSILFAIPLLGTGLNCSKIIEDKVSTETDKEFRE